MNRTSLRQRAKIATIDVDAAIQVILDIDDAIHRRDVVMLRAFAAEAGRSVLDAEGARAREFADLIEGKAGASAREELLRIKADRDELLRIKSALAAPPTQAQLVRQWDSEQMAAAMSHGAPFDVNTFEAREAERVAEANRQLSARVRRHEEQRAAQVAAAEQPKGPGR